MSENTDSPTSRKDRLAFDRWDRLGLALLLALVALLALGDAVIGPLAGWARGSDLSVPYVSEVTVPSLDRVGQRYGEGRYDLGVDDPTTGQRLLDLAPGVLSTAIVVAACLLVLRVMRDIGRGEPFAPGNVSRLRLLAALLALGIPVAHFARSACTGAILAGVDLGALPPAQMIELPWLPVVAGACVALVAEAFKAGARLRDDVDGLV